MSLSIQARLDDVEKLVRLAMETLGDNEVDALFIDGDAAPFSEIQPTTWEEAKRRGYVKDRGWQTYQFAANGWLKGVELLKLTEDAAFAQKLSKLSATLRSYVTLHQSPQSRHERMPS